MKIEDFKKLKINKGEALFFQTKNLRDKENIHEFIQNLGEFLGTIVYLIDDFNDMKVIKVSKTPKT